MYLVSDASHTPCCTFDEFNDAIACVTGWTQRSARWVRLDHIPKTTMYKVITLDEQKLVLGYITEGIIHNPPIIHY